MESSGRASVWLGFEMGVPFHLDLVVASFGIVEDWKVEIPSAVAGIEA